MLVIDYARDAFLGLISPQIRIVFIPMFKLMLKV